MLAVTTSEILKRSVWCDDFQAWPAGDTEKATVLRSFHTSVLNRWSRWLTFPDVRVYYLFPACVGAQESGGLTWRLEKHQTEFRENVNHTSVLAANLSPCHFSAVATASCVCTVTDIMTLYATSIHAGINQRRVVTRMGLGYWTESYKEKINYLLHFIYSSVSDHNCLSKVPVVKEVTLRVSALFHTIQLRPLLRGQKVKKSIHIVYISHILYLHYHL